MSSPQSERSEVADLLERVMQAAGPTDQTVESWAEAELAKLIERGEGRLADAEAFNAEYEAEPEGTDRKRYLAAAGAALALKSARLAAEDSVAEAGLRIALAAAQGNLKRVVYYLNLLDTCLATWYALMIGATDITIHEEGAVPTTTPQGEKS